MKPGRFVVEHTPEKIVDEVERYFLALLLLVVGVDSTFFGAQTGVLSENPDARLIEIEIGICFISSCIFTWMGLWRGRVWQQSLGASLAILGCGGFLLGIWLYIGTEGTPQVIIYVVIGLVYTLRLLSSAVKRYKIKYRFHSNEAGDSWTQRPSD